MCHKGLIERGSSDQDRRNVALTLTEAGVAMVESFLPEVCGLLERQGAGLPPRESMQPERLLKKFLDHFGQA